MAEPLDLEKLEARLATATPDPQERVHGITMSAVRKNDEPPYGWIIQMPRDDGEFLLYYAAEFFSSAQNLRALIAEVRRLREDDRRQVESGLLRDIAKLQAQVDRMRPALEKIADWGCELDTFKRDGKGSSCNLDQIKIAREALKEPQP